MWGPLEMLHTGSPHEPHSPCSVDVGCWGFLCPHPGAPTRRSLEAAQSGKSQEALEVLQAPASSEVETMLVPLHTSVPASPQPQLPLGQLRA